MPSIIEAPVRTRSDKRSVTLGEMAEYVSAMNEVDGTEQVVLVDDSETDNYEKSYAKGERIRIALYKENGMDRKVKVVAFKNGSKNEDGAELFVCAMSWK